LLIARLYTGGDYFASYLSLVKEVWESYGNVNFLLKRVKPYVAVGRNQTEAESDAIQVRLKEMLDFFAIPYKEVIANRFAPRLILNHLKRLSARKSVI
jgi:hypothetical protein